MPKLCADFSGRDFDSAKFETYNGRVRIDYERIRDFIILHYHANERSDAPFWIRCREMGIPETLAHKIALFRSQGQIVREADELFVEIGWFQVLTGQNIMPGSYHPMARSEGHTSELQSLMRSSSAVLCLKNKK